MKLTVKNKWLVIDHEDSNSTIDIVDMNKIVKLEKGHTSVPELYPEKSGWATYHISIETIHGSQRFDFIKKVDRDGVFNQIKEYILRNCA